MYVYVCFKTLKGGVQGRSSLHVAVQDNAVKTVRLLLENDADMDIQDQEAS